MGKIRKEVKEENRRDHHTCNAARTRQRLVPEAKVRCPSNPSCTTFLRPLLPTQAQPVLDTSITVYCVLGWKKECSDLIRSVSWVISCVVDFYDDHRFLCSPFFSHLVSNRQLAGSRRLHMIMHTTGSYLLVE